MTQSNYKGRQPLFTPLKAFEILEARKMFSAETTTEQFIAEMVSADVIPRTCCRASMHRLLSGKMFPSLKRFDATGVATEEPYRYSDIPKVRSGRPFRPESRDPDTGEPRRPMTKIRRWLLNDTVRTLKVHIAAELHVLEERLLAMADRRIDQMADEMRREFAPKSPSSPVVKPPLI